MKRQIKTEKSGKSKKAGQNQPLRKRKPDKNLKTKKIKPEKTP